MFSDLSLEVLTTYTCVSVTHNSAVIPQFLFSISAPVKVSGSHIWWFELVLSKDYWCCRQWHAWFQVVSDQWSFRHLSLLQPNSALTTWPWTKLWVRSLDIKSLRGHNGMVSGLALMWHFSNLLKHSKPYIQGATQGSMSCQRILWHTDWSSQGSNQEPLNR